MIRKVSIASALALCAAAGAASARNYTGSDTLRVFTQTLVTQCGAVAGGTTFPALAGATPQYAYIGGGSGQGGTDMRNGEQDIAPQSRALSNAEACETAIEANPSTGTGNLGNDEAAFTASPAGSGAEGLVIGLDGMSIAVAPNTGARCDTTPTDGFAAPLAFSTGKTFPVTNFTTNVPDGAANISTFSDVPLPAPGAGLELVGSTLSYRVTDFKDVLRILFAGADKTRTASTLAGGGGAATQTAANRLSRCSSDIRRSLVSNWDNLVEADPATCTGQASCGTLRRLYRRADDSGTTDTFLALLSLAGIANQPFCNGTERQDQDPVRRTCVADDDVCGAANLGLVQTVEVYQLVNVTQASLHAAWYPTTPCAQGVFVLRDAPFLPGGAGSATTCPDGAPQVLGQCLTPQSGPASATGTAVGGNCLNPQLNTSFLTPGGNDGRAWNRELRSSAGNMRNELITGQTVPTGVTNAIHRTRSRVGGTGGQCLFDDATQTIGCIAGNMQCALGFAGREATDNPVTTPIAVAAPVGNVPPSVANIQALINNTLGTPYPLARKLYFNSIIGFDQIRDEVPATAAAAEQEQLIKCLEGPVGPHQAALAAAGFIPVPALPAGVANPGHIVEFRTGGTGATGTAGLVCEDVNEITACTGSVDTPNCVQL